jgi:hypothetical protein
MGETTDSSSQPSKPGKRDLPLAPTSFVRTRLSDTVGVHVVQSTSNVDQDRKDQDR